MTPKSVAVGRVDAMCSAITSGVLDDVVLVRRRKGLQDERQRRFVSQIVVRPGARLPRRGGLAFLRDHVIHWFEVSGLSNAIATTAKSALMDLANRRP